MSRVGFIGTGHIAAPMARALARSGHRVTVSERSAETAAELVGAGLGIQVAPNQQVLERSEIVFLCLRPSVWESVSTTLEWRPDHSVISVMAGISLDDLHRACAPATDISATIPYAFVEHGGCPLPVVGNPAALQALFGADNPVLPQTDADALTHFFAASSLVSAVLGLLEGGANWLGPRTGDGDSAETYLAALVGGFLSHGSFESAGRLAEEKWGLATPNTLNRQMVDGLEGQGAFADLPSLLDRIAASMGGDK